MESHNTTKILRSMDRAIIRKAALEGGWYNKPKVQVHKNAKAYSRKRKHRDVN